MPTTRSALASTLLALVTFACSGGALNPRAAALNSRGTAQLRAGDTSGAEASFHLALEYNDRFAEPYNNLGLVDLVHGRVADARRHFQAAIDRNRDFAEAWSNLGTALAASTGPDDHDGGDRRAMSAWHEALSIDPGLIEARVNLVRAQLRTHQAREAIDQARRLVQLAPDNALAHELRSTAALVVNAPAEALASAREARRLDAHDPEVAIVLAQAELAGGSPANVAPLVNDLVGPGRIGMRAQALRGAASLAMGNREAAQRDLAEIGPAGLGEPLVRALLIALDMR